jgi:hypothetical protein
VVSSPTSTATAVPQSTKGYPEITDVKPYPNPFNPSRYPFFTVDFTSSQCIRSAELDIYTSALRHIKSLSSTGIPSCRPEYVLNFSTRGLSGMSSGMYYCILRVIGLDNKTATSKSFILLVIR